MGTHTHFAGATRRAAFDASRTCPRFIIAAAFGLLASLAAQGSMAQAVSVDEGHDLVQLDCAMCHAVDRTGASPNPGAPAFRDLHLRYPVNSLAVALAEGTIIGHPQMPQYKFSTDQIADIIRYLNSIQTLQPSRIDPVNHPSRSSGSLATQRVPANP
jgi:cytochrome c